MHQALERIVCHCQIARETEAAGVYHTRIRDVNHLKTSLVKEWQKFDHKIIDWQIKQWHMSTREVVHSTRSRTLSSQEQDTVSIGCKAVDRQTVSDHE